MAPPKPRRDPPPISSSNRNCHNYWVWPLRPPPGLFLSTQHEMIMRWPPPSGTDNAARSQTLAGVLTALVKWRRRTDG